MFACRTPGHLPYRQFAAPARAAFMDTLGRGLGRLHAVGGRLIVPATLEFQSRRGCGVVGAGRVDARGFKVHFWFVVSPRAGWRAVAALVRCR